MIILDAKIIIIQIVVVLALCIILKRLFFIPMMDLLDARKGHVDTAVKAQEEKREGISKLVGQYEQNIADAKKKAVELREEVRKEGLEREREILEEAHKAHADAIHEAKEKAQKEFEDAKKEIKDQVKSLSVNVAEKILQRKV